MMSVRELNRLTRARELIASGRGRQIREARRLTLGDIARAVGCVESSVSRWERSKRLGRSPKALRYAELILALENGGPEVTT